MANPEKPLSLFHGYSTLRDFFRLTAFGHGKPPEGALGEELPTEPIGTITNHIHFDSGTLIDALPSTLQPMSAVGTNALSQIHANGLTAHNDLDPLRGHRQKPFDVRAFEAGVEAIDFANVVSAPDDYDIPRGTKGCRVVPLVPTYDLGTIGTVNLCGGSSLKIPKDVTCDYHGHAKGLPYLDSGIAVGMVYQGRLSALAAATIPDPDTVRIVQLQAVTARAKDPKTRRTTGLTRGFDWRETLVNTWAGLAPTLGATAIEIQSARHNVWNDGSAETSERYGHFYKAYDQVALRMGFIVTDDGNWRKTLTDQE